jgi:hypothetical protein
MHNPFLDETSKIIRNKDGEVGFQRVNLWDYFDWKDKKNWKFSSKKKSWFIESWFKKTYRFDMFLTDMADMFVDEIPPTKNGSYPFFSMWLEESIKWDEKCRFEEPKKYELLDAMFLSDPDVPVHLIEQRKQLCSKR